MPDFVLAIDAGGTAVKAAVFSPDGEEAGVASRVLRPITPAPGFAERDADQLWRAAAEAVRAALAGAGLSGADVAAVGITGHGNGLYLVDAEGRPAANGILATDIRASAVVEEWRAAGLETEHVARTYQPLWPGRPAAILAWLKRHRPEVLAGSAAALMCKDLLRLRLTGRLAAEVTDQSTAALLPGDRRERDPGLLDLLGLADCERLLPPLVETMAVAGAVTVEAAEATGLRSGTPVSAGCCDNLAVMYGTGITDPAGLVVMSGTWGLHQSFLERPVTDGSLVIVAHGAVPGQWLAIEGSPTSATCFEWFVDTFVRRSADEPSEALYELCAARLAETSADGPAVYFLPFINGAIDDASARGTLVGLSGWHHLGHAVRAVFEGVAFEHRRHLERLLRWRPRPERARFAGGAARSRPWSEIFAATLDLTLETPRGSEFGAAGAAVLASVAAGLSPDIPTAAGAMTTLARTIDPDPTLKTTLDRRYGVYRHLTAALGPCWGEVAG